MTMVHIATKAISRKAGQSAVACAAYRAGDVLEDAKYGKVHDYSKKDGVMSSDIVMPASLRKGYVKIDREILWNTAEAFEARSDSRVAREWLINLPYELPEDERHALALEFAQKLCDDMDVIADVCLHRPVMKLPFDPNAKPSSKRLREGEQNPDPRNFHAHIMVTTRAPVIGPDGKLAFDPKFKIPFEWSNKKRQQNDLPSSREEIKRIRKLWVDTANQRLKHRNLPLMDERSYKDQGLDQQPTIKMGVEATAMERRGIATEKGETNRKIQARNHAVLEQRREYERRIQQYRDGLAWATGQNERLSGLIADTERRADSTKRCIEDAKSGTAWAAERCENLPNRIDDADKANHEAQQRIDVSKRAVADSQPRVDDSKRAVNDSKRAVIASEQAITTRVNERPNPFTDRRTASVNKRKQSSAELAEQERRADTDAHFYKREDERVAKRVETIKLQLANKLLNKDEHELKWWNYETSEVYPNKFDKRQIKILEDFEKSLNLEFDEDTHPYEKLKQTAQLMNADFIEQNKDVLKLLKDPANEREQYNERLTAFNEFKESLDQEREQLHEQLKQQLGYGGDVGRMTRDTLTSVDYIQKLDNFINDDSQNADARKLAEEHRADTLGKTCEQFRLSYYDVLKLRDNNERVNYANALNSSLERFQQVYGSELSESQNKAIQLGVYSFERDIQQSQRMNYTR